MLLCVASAAICIKTVSLRTLPSYSYITIIHMNTCATALDNDGLDNKDFITFNFHEIFEIP